MSRTVRAMVPRIRLGDTCDRCVGRALLAVVLGDKNNKPVGEPLRFCLHHADKAELILFGKSNIISFTDRRDEFVAQTRGEDNLVAVA